MWVESFNDFVADIENLYANKLKGNHEPVWYKIIVQNLIRFFCQEDLIKARACYLAVKRDPLILFTTEEEHATRMDEHLKPVHKVTTVNDFFYFLTQKLISKFNADKANDSFLGPFRKRQHKTCSRLNHRKKILSNLQLFCTYALGR